MMVPHTFRRKRNGLRAEEQGGAGHVWWVVGGCRTVEGATTQYLKTTGNTTPKPLMASF